MKSMAGGENPELETANGSWEFLTFQFDYHAAALGDCFGDLLKLAINAVMALDDAEWSRSMTNRLIHRTVYDLPFLLFRCRIKIFTL